MSLIRFDDTSRAPSASLWRDLVDWVKGSLSTELGNRDFDDYSPYDASGSLVAGTAGVAETLQLVRDGVVGVVRLSATAGANAEAGKVRQVATQLDKVNLAIIEGRFVRNDSADVQITVVGLTDQTGDTVLASNALAVGGGQDFIGLRWNDNGTIDVVSVLNGAAVVVHAAAVATKVMGTSTGYTKVGLRIERITDTLYRLTPCVDGSIIRSKAVNVASSAIPAAVALRPCVVAGTDATTAPSLDQDWLFFADK